MCRCGDLDCRICCCNENCECDSCMTSIQHVLCVPCISCSWCLYENASRGLRMGPPTDPSECAECCDSSDKDMWFSCQCCCMEEHCELCWCCRMGRQLICCPCCVGGYFCACLACDCDYEVIDRVLAWTLKDIGTDENVWGLRIESNENPNSGSSEVEISEER